MPNHKPARKYPDIGDSPLIAIRMYERPPDGQREPQNTAGYERAIEAASFRCNEPDVAQSLFDLVQWLDSEGAARALRATKIVAVRRRVSEEVKRYLRVQPAAAEPRRGDKNRLSHMMPLVLGRDGNDAELRLLAKAVRYRPNRKPAPLDTLFRLNAAESLSTIDHPVARRALLGVLVDAEDDPDVREACYLLLRRSLTPEVMQAYRWVEEMPRSQALKELAKIHVGGFKGHFVRLKKYEPVLDSLQALLRHLEEKQAQGVSTSPEPAAKPTSPQTLHERPTMKPTPVAEPLPQASPTKETQVAPATPAIGRQAGGERPMAGSDEGDLHLPPIPAAGYCFDCIHKMRAMGMLSEEQANQLTSVPTSDCVNCCS